MKIAPAFVVVTALSGCAAYNQVLINADGHEVYCDSVGAGIFWSAVAGQSFESCINSRRAAGYLEVEKAGALGATFNDQGYVLRLVPRGPAMTAGLKVNDQVVAINGIAANTSREIHALLFVPVGAHLTLSVKRGGSEQNLQVTSESWSKINGFKPVRGSTDIP